MTSATRAGLIGATLLLATAGTACAEPVSATVGITVNALVGRHEAEEGTSRVTFAPLPLVESEWRWHSFSVHAEGLPSVAVRYGAGAAVQATRLGLLNATARAELGSGFFAGAGTTIYNQETTYPPINGTVRFYYGDVSPIAGSEIQASRVAGLRLDLGRRFRIGPDEIEASGAFNPAMRGVQRTYVPTGRSIGAYNDPERASQVDLSLRAAHPVRGRVDVIYGLRYLNYVAHYESHPGILADRNVGWMPVLGVRAHL